MLEIGVAFFKCQKRSKSAVVLFPHLIRHVSYTYLLLKLTSLSLRHFIFLPKGVLTMAADDRTIVKRRSVLGCCCNHIYRGPSLGLLRGDVISKIYSYLVYGTNLSIFYPPLHHSGFNYHHHLHTSNSTCPTHSEPVRVRATCLPRSSGNMVCPTSPSTSSP